MKTINKKVSSLVLAAALGASSVASAIDMKWYVGGELAYNKLSHSKDNKDLADAAAVKLKNSTPSASLIAGVRLNEYVGVEAGYTFMKKIKMKEQSAATVAGTPAQYDMKVRNIHLDVNGFYPVCNDIDVIGTVGLGKLQAKTATQKASKIGYRLGAGAQYKFNESVAVRAMVRYQQAGGKSNDVRLLKSNTSLALGTTYSF